MRQVSVNGVNYSSACGDRLSLNMRKDISIIFAFAFGAAAAAVGVN
jgi:hypothetical protein